MTDYYKALRPDGKDFATGMTKPRKNRWMPRIEGDLVMCGRGYHVSEAVAETLVGGYWPCKLARVEIPEGSWEKEFHKLVVPTYRVIEWLPSHMALGPNGEAVAALIERAAKLTLDERYRLDAAWNAERYETRYAAWHAERDVARDVAWDVAWEAARDAAYRAMRDAVMALVVRDLISEEYFNALCGPWQEVLGE